MLKKVVNPERNYIKHIVCSESTFQLFKSCYAEFAKHNPTISKLNVKVTENMILKAICEFYLRTE